MFWNKKKSEPSSGFTESSKSGFGNAEFEAEEERDSYWDKFTQVQLSENAINWFGEFKPSDFQSSGTKAQLAVHEDFTETIHRVLDHISGSSTDPDEAGFLQIVKSIVSDYNPTVFPEMEINPATLNSIDIGESKLGKKILAALDKAGIAYGTSPADDSGVEASIFMRFEDTRAGNLNLQYLRIYEDESGKECAYWHIHLLASNRPIDYRYIAESKGGKPFSENWSDDPQFSSPEGQYNMQWVIPSLMKDVAFLAECPSYSTAGPIFFSRDLAFGGVSAKARPKPAFAIVRDERFEFSNDSEDSEFTKIKPPHTVLFGWVLTESSLAQFSEILPVISAGCSFALNLFEEGEDESASKWTGLDWDMKLRPPAVLASSFPEKYGHRYPAEWMTIPEYWHRQAHVVSNYNDAYNAESPEDWKKGFEDLLENGSDSFVLHAANTLVFSGYLQSVISDEAELETALEILAMAFNIDPHCYFDGVQASNALSNAGVLYYQAGKLERAEEVLLRVMERYESSGDDLEDGVAAEASFVLRLICLELAESAPYPDYYLDAAYEHEQMCLELGGYDSGSGLRRPSITPGSSSACGNPNWCPRCGQLFLISQNFCPGCGVSRDREVDGDTLEIDSRED